MEIFGYIGYFILIFFSLTWMLGVRIKLETGLSTIICSLFYTVCSILLTISEINKYHSWWILPMGFFLVMLSSKIMGYRIFILHNLIKIIGSTYGRLIRIGIPAEKIKAAQHADAKEIVEKMFSKDK